MDFQHYNVSRTRADGEEARKFRKGENERRARDPERVEEKRIASRIALFVVYPRGSAIAIGDYVNQTRAVYAPAICPGIIFP